MQKNNTVTINGRLYDAVTGLPVTAKPIPKPTVRSGSTAASSVHSQAQRSQTLNRRATKKPAPAKRPNTGRHMDVARSSKISRFAPHPQSKPETKSEAPDIKPKTHPAVTRALARTVASPKVSSKTPPTSKQIKDSAIATALSKPGIKPVKQKRFQWRWSRRFTIVTSIFAVLMIGAFLTFINLPTLSVGFAAAQAGIKATYPEYRPDGYSLSQPVTFSDGEVTLVFRSNSDASSYTVLQSRSSWDSSAVLDNVVRKEAGDNYVTTQERGLTIYTYDGSNAAWVNGGILYTIKSSAPLSGEQIRRIATSL